MDPVRITVLLAGALFLAFGLSAYRHFYTVLGGTAGLAIWVGLKDTILRIPGLREHPGTAGVLVMLLMVLTGVILARKFRRVIAFVGGFGTGLILSQMAASYLGAAPGSFPPAHGPAPMDILAGLVGGVLFLLFERVLAVLLTSAVGAVLCTLALGGVWTFPACLALGVAAQPLIYRRLKPPGDRDGRENTGTTAILSLFMILALPSSASADWVVERIIPASSRIVIRAGWRDGVRLGEQYAVVDERGSLAAVIRIAEVFSSSSYSGYVPHENLQLVRTGMQVVVMEEYDFARAMERESETHLSEFLSRYPESSHVPEVKDALDALRFRQAEMAGTIDAFREFQRRFPTSRYSAKARRREEEMAFAMALEKGTEEGFRSFLERFPGSDFVSGMVEVRRFFTARGTGKVFAYQDFLAAYPKSRLADEFIPSIEEFEMWAEKLEFGSDPVEAIRHFGELGDETAVPLLVGKLTVPSLEEESRKAIFLIGKPALGILMEVLISPLQSLELKDKVAFIIGQMGDLSAIPAMRTYVREENTEKGRKALLTLEEKVGR